ncbi:aspartyl protease family protein 1-like [Lotus japonicus]|uniref:aspartyl protease family protein 1-like n=1 Tax=Lotus japonicus TaxID=34305 RepID=UPI00258CE107|nr:aspartyl protease family protein 1-like [Lotus japonicus]
MLFKSFSCGLKKMLSLCRMITIFLFLLSVCGCCHGQIYTFTMYHRYSEPVKKWCHSATETLEKGNCEYYAELADRDRTRLSFSGGNSSTFRINSLGFLHYATVQLGTPGVKFMVALDTGSDLFWVPCDCVRCASLDSTAYGSDFDLSTYSPSRSSTSKKVTCNSSLCMNHNQCHGAFSNCPYMVSYASAETSTSGILVEDVLHFTDGDNHHIEANVMFGLVSLLKNFMTGYHVVFDREKLILGWKQSNCYDDIEDNAVSIGPHSDNVPSTFTTGLVNYLGW